MIEMIDGCCELKACGLCDKKCELVEALKQTIKKSYEEIGR